MKHFLLLVLLFISKVCLAQTFYTFIGNGNWTIAANWSNNVIPPSPLSAGSTITINPPPGDSCVLNTIQTISTGAILNVNAGANFIIRGGILYHSAAEGNLLAKLILLDTTTASPNDTITILAYSYDTQQRVEKSILTEDYKTEEEESSFIEYFYNGNDTMPYKISENGNYLHYRFYNMSGRVIKDSVNISFDNAPGVEEAFYTNNYNYNADSIFLKTITYAFVPGESYDTIIQISANGNVITQFSLSFNYGYTFQFDDHPNPMYKSKNSINPDYPLFSGDSTFTIGQQKNNYTEIRSAYADGSHNKYTYQYSYQQNGYPAYFRCYNISTGIPVYAGTGIYQYIR